MTNGPTTQAVEAGIDNQNKLCLYSYRMNSKSANTAARAMPGQPAAPTKPLPAGRNGAIEEIDWLTTKLAMPRRKGHITLRIDAEVLDWFRGQGKGYQTRINAILRRYFEQHTR
jgi:uncharacterized protein (DUF4415 family)